MAALCHRWFTTTKLSYRFPSLKLPQPPCAVLLLHQIQLIYTSCGFWLSGEHTWWFPKIGGPPSSHPLIDWDFPTLSSFWGTCICWNHPYHYYSLLTITNHHEKPPYIPFIFSEPPKFSSKQTPQKGPSPGPSHLRHSQDARREEAMKAFYRPKPWLQAELWAMKSQYNDSAGWYWGPTRLERSAWDQFLSCVEPQT